MVLVNSENIFMEIFESLNKTTAKRIRDRSIVSSIKGPYFNYVSTFLTIFDQLSNLVSMFTK